MKTYSVKKLFFTLTLGTATVVAAACSTPPTPTVVSATAKPAPTQAPVLPTATKALPTTAPTAVPTQVPTATHVLPTATPVQPTAAPTQATAEPTATALAMLPLGKSQTVNNLSVLPSKIAWQTQSGTDKPKTGDTYLFVTVNLENLSKTDPISFDPAQVVLLSPDGKTTLPSLTLKSATTQIKAQTLKPGAKVSGVVVFEVPQSQQKSAWNLQFKSSAGPALEWSIAA